MKFKNKIIISFCIIIFVPIALALLVLFSFQHIQIKAIEQTYGVESEDYSYFPIPYSSSAGLRGNRLKNYLTQPRMIPRS